MLLVKLRSASLTRPRRLFCCNLCCRGLVFRLNLEQSKKQFCVNTKSFVIIGHVQAPPHIVVLCPHIAKEMKKKKGWMQVTKVCLWAMCAVGRTTIVAVRVINNRDNEILFHHAADAAVINCHFCPPLSIFPPATNDGGAIRKRPMCPHCSQPEHTYCPTESIHCCTLITLLPKKLWTQRLGTVIASKTIKCARNCSFHKSTVLTMNELLLLPPAHVMIKNDFTLHPL